MDSEKPLVIGYSGSLYFYEDGKNRVPENSLKDWFWTYNYNSTDPSTRSASFLFRAVRELRKNQQLSPADLRIQLWGKIDPRYQAQAKEYGIDDLITIEGYLPKQESLKRNEACDLLFLPMESATEAGKPLFIPGKVFEYMKAAKPVLLLSGPCDCRDILEPSGLLIGFDPEDYKGIAAKLAELIRDRNKLQEYQPRTDYINRFSFRNITGKLAGIFDEILHHGH